MAEFVYGEQWEQWERHSCASFDQFSVELCKIFRFQSCGAEASGGLIGLRQGVHMVVDYSIDFRTRAIQRIGIVRRNSSALCDAFYHGLVDYIKDQLVSYERPLL